MRIARPADPADREAMMVALRLGPRGEEWIARMFLPWRIADSGEYQMHASSLPLLLRSRAFRGFADDAARAWCRRYLRAARRTFTAAKLRPREAYPWARLLSPDWTPRAYQEAGMEIAYERLTRFGGGLLLADDVGLGKTVQAIGVFLRLRAEGKLPGPLVVYTESTLKSQWGDEIRRFAPGVSVSVVDGGYAERAERMAPGRDAYVLNYELARLPRYRAAVDGLAARCGMVVLDETYRIANPSSATNRAICRFARGARYRLAFNATPIENAIVDIYAQFRPLDPRAIGTAEGFERYVVRDYMGKPKGVRRLREFKLRAAVLYLRRTRDECGVELPDVTTEARPVELAGPQLAAYRAAVAEFCGSDGEDAAALAGLAAVRYAAFAADVGDPRSASAKADALAAMLRGELSGEKVVVFSQFRRVIDFTAARLRAAGVGAYVIHGQVSNAERAAVRRRFTAAHSARRVVLGTDAMARGLNLQAAGVVVNLDLPWTPGRLRQRIGRVRRIGQARKVVLVVNLLASVPGARTIDDWMVGVVHGKRGLVRRFFGADDVDEIGAEGDAARLRRFLSRGICAAQMRGRAPRRGNPGV